MTVKDLIEKLKKYDENKEICIFDWETDENCNIEEVKIDSNGNVVIFYT